MGYRDLLDFSDQRIVDEIYKRYKGEEENQALDEVYREVTNKNQTRIKTTQYQYNRILDKISQILSIIGMIIFAILFICLGAILLSVLIGYIQLIFMDQTKGLYDFVCQIGEGIYGFLLNNSIQEIIQGSASDLQISFFYYIMGLSFLLIIVFLGLYIYSFFKKTETKELRQLTIEESHHYLQTNEDDDWNYIKSQFYKRIKNRRKKDLYEHYYQSYINLYNQYQTVEGHFKDLAQKDQIKLCFFTAINSLKNILGALVYPAYMSLAIMIFYYQSFFYGDGLLEPVLREIPLGMVFMNILNICYDFLMKFPIFKIFVRFHLELSKMLSFCICLTVLWYIYSIIKTRIPECKRQFHRRLNYYLKRKQNIYDSQKKYSKCYLYSVQFFFFIILAICLAFIYNHNANYFISMFVPIQQKREIQSYMDIRDQIYTKLENYALKNNDVLSDKNVLFSSDYIFVDELRDADHHTYLKVYTFYNVKEAKAAMKESSLLKNHQLITNKQKIQYYYSNDGVILRDHTTLIVMKNNDKINDSLCNDMEKANAKYTKKNIKKIIRSIGYKI